MIDDNPFHQDRDTRRFAFVCEKVTTFLQNNTWIQSNEIEINNAASCHEKYSM